jgi:hypothetical protein
MFSLNSKPNLCRFFLSFVYNSIVVGRCNYQEGRGWDPIDRVQTKFYWSWAGGPVLIVRTGVSFIFEIINIFYLQITCFIRVKENMLQLLQNLRV